MQVSIIIPVAKEGDHLYKTIYKLYEQLHALSRPLGIHFDMILVTDVLHFPTLKVMARLAREKIADSLLLTTRLGKGGSIKNAVPFARGDYVVILDADAPVKPELIIGAIVVAMERGLDFLAANRLYRTHNLLRRLLSTAYNTLVNLFFQTGLRDHQAGFKIISRRAARLLLVGMTRTDGLAFDTELIVWARRLGFTFTTINVAWREQRTGSTILPFRALLTMFADLLMLRLLTLRGKHVALKRMIIGKVLDLNGPRVLGPEVMTTISSKGAKAALLTALRKLYLATAFRKR